MLFSKYFVPALISLLGVILTACVSYIVNKRQTKIELHKIISNYGGPLHEKRIEHYPNLYVIISSLIKQIRTDFPCKSEINKVLDNLKEWDSKYAIFMGTDAVKSLYDVWQELTRLSTLSASQFNNVSSDSKLRFKLIVCLQNLELSLKRELGVFIFESPIDFRDKVNYGSYRQALSEGAADSPEDMVVEIISKKANKSEYTD